MIAIKAGRSGDWVSALRCHEIRTIYPADISTASIIRTSGKPAYIYRNEISPSISWFHRFDHDFNGYFFLLPDRNYVLLIKMDAVTRRTFVYLYKKKVGRVRADRSK